MTREQYIRNQQIIQNRLMKKYFTQIFQALRDQMNQSAAMVQAHGIHYTLNHLNRNFQINNQLALVITNLYKDAAIQAKAKFRLTKAANFGFDFDFVTAVLDYFAQYILEKVVLPITQTTIDLIKKTLDDAIAQGWGVEKTVQELGKPDIPRWRAKLIVRTEAVRAMNYSQWKAADNENFETQKMWIAVDDKRTRRSHGHFGVDGEVRDLADKFSNGLLFPGDPDGGAAEVCNCFLPNELTSINPKNIKRAFKSFYQGKVVTIKTTSGKSFTCTINHPILTTKGWIGAGLLTNQSELIKSESINSFMSNFNVKSSPSTFEQIFNSFSKFRNTMWMSTGIVDFYGDISAGDVDIVSVKRKLNNRIIHFNKIKNQFLIDSYFSSHIGPCLCSFFSWLSKKIGRQISNFLICFCGQFLALFKRGFFHSFKHTFASISLNDSSFVKSVDNNISGTFKFNRKSFNTISLFKKINDFFIINFMFYRIFFNVKIFFNKNLFKKIKITAKDFPDFCNLHASFIKFDNISSVRVHQYEGYVYTFETVHQMYDINSLVALNCRCTLGYSLKRDLDGNLIPKEKNVLQP